MKCRVLMGKLVGKQLDAKTIKWKLGLTWGDRVKNPFYLDHFGHRWIFEDELLPTLVDEFSYVEREAHAYGGNTQEQFEEDEGWTTVLSVKDVMDLEAGEEVFMEIEGGEIEQVHIIGNRKRIRSKAKGEAGPSYNLEDVD
ncbi:hypothetical protein C1H46_019508 [Malus baccata]|uniref:Uncharacterized protein n=1 Tax=Malus baccata TaxID=106549 RepID=A0A540M7Z7_MALBA|nr:hypothetical protein C1H46_019508 [Malus baccata]